MSDKIEFKVFVGPPVDIDEQPPCVTIAGHPPLPGEGSGAYINRVQREVYQELFAPKPSLFERIGARLRGAV